MSIISTTYTPTPNATDGSAKLVWWESVQSKGGTFTRNGSEYSPSDKTNGFYVSLSGGLEGIPDDLFDQNLIEAVTWKWWLTLAMQNDYLVNYRTEIMFGTWFDSNTGTWSIDQVVWVQNRDEALKLSLAHKQLAYWDIANLYEIRT